MKKKSLERKLTFKKETLSDLGIKQMNEVHGGVSGYVTCFHTCPGCKTYGDITCICPYER